MKALYIRGVRDIAIGDASEPDPGNDRVRVAIAGVGVCGSDLHYYLEGGIGSQVIAEPFVPGHEFAARLLEDRPDLGLAKGDLVAAANQRGEIFIVDLAAGTAALCARSGPVDQRKIACFASRKSWVQIPAGPSIVSTDHQGPPCLAPLRWHAQEPGAGPLAVWDAGTSLQLKVALRLVERLSRRMQRELPLQSRVEIVPAHPQEIWLALHLDLPVDDDGRGGSNPVFPRKAVDTDVRLGQVAFDEEARGAFPNLDHAQRRPA